MPGYLNIACNYQLMVDNLLDLTHVVFVHKTTLAGGGVTDTPLDVRVEGDRVLVAAHDAQCRHCTDLSRARAD